MDIYFVDEQHKQNYERLQEIFNRVDFDNDGEYRSACYLAAYPGIFKCINMERVAESGPFGFYFDYLEDPATFAERRDRGETSGDTAPLTGQTREMVRIGISLWNGGECDLSVLSYLDQKLYFVVLQAIDLRRRRPEIDFARLEDIAHAWRYGRGIDIWEAENVE